MNDKTTLLHELLRFSDKHASAVLLNDEDWRAHQETLNLLAVTGMRESIKHGMSEPLAASAKTLSW